MFRIRLVWTLLVSAAVTVLAATGAAAQAPDVDLQCLLSSCGPLAAACAADANCQAIQSCITACAGDAACNNACFFKLADDPYAKLALCAVDAGCIAGPPSLGNETCPDLSGAKLASGFNTSWLAEAGTMYVAGGGNPVYDCFDCQLLEFSPAPDGGVDVVWSAALNGTVRNATYTLEPAAPGVLNTSYELFSLPVEETYYILDYTEDGSYLLYFYCGSLLGSEYTGAVIYSREPDTPVPSDVKARFSAAVAAAGLQDYVKLDSFCTPAYPSTCPNL
ncbi:hypothetical protein ABPG77_006892 [Micractinium sp. CCAP 211/92]